ncbi:MAG: hypothetical protein WKH64_09350 [Chloroflexia bacterium]
MAEYAAMWQDADEFVSMLDTTPSTEVAQAEQSGPAAGAESEFDGIEAITMCYHREVA